MSVPHLGLMMFVFLTADRKTIDLSRPNTKRAHLPPPPPLAVKEACRVILELPFWYLTRLRLTATPSLHPSIVH